ncbi:GUN4 N-terminal ARM-like repeat domain-containing protein [Capilliphycus salinus ALCB114379]|uniref:GUN4 N-terminal ARM-like repeat domain-containing protein n=1 Tax=Capilliphycus salinus TaxID=2768948 RepID=UPI0039A455CF
MTDSITTFKAEDASLNPDEVRSQLNSGTTETKLKLIQALAEAGEVGLPVLMEFLLERRSASITPVEGKVYQILYRVNSEPVQDFLKTHFQDGLLSVASEAEVDYSPLQQLLAEQNFLEADKLTLQKLCELAGETAIDRKWIYFSEVKRFSTTDLQTIDLLWQIYSEGKFGYSVQRKLWLGVGRNWEKLWPKIGWRQNGTWTRYPQGFTWDLTAPVGHLPLSNQLRGVRVIEAIFSHPAWSNQQG